MRSAASLLLLVALAFGDSGCTLLLDDDARQCSSDSDCAALGLEESSCSGTICVRRSGVGGSSAGSAAKLPGNAGNSAQGGSNDSAAGSQNTVGGHEAPGAAGIGSQGGVNAAAGSAGAAQGGAAAGQPGASGSAGRAGSSPTVELDLIDDFEDFDRVVRLVNSPKRDGLWDASNDGSGTQTPAPGQLAAVLLNGDTPHENDLYAGYTKGSGFSGWGAFLKVDMRNWAIFDETPQYDASGYSGVAFWAKAGATSSTRLRVRFVSGDTDPRGHKCKAPHVNPPQNQLCFNHYFADVTLTKSWQAYTLAFSDFSQGVDGMISPSINLAEMYGLEFFFSGSTPFEIWVDDLSFVRK